MRRNDRCRREVRVAQIDRLVFCLFFLSSNDQERGKCSSLVLANLPIFSPKIQATWGMETSTEVVQIWDKKKGVVGRYESRKLAGWFFAFFLSHHHSRMGKVWLVHSR